MQQLHIGDIASRTGRSVHTIRWYERQGLIPGVCRDGGGRRVYSDYHVGWLDLMERLRSTGMSIKVMREYTARSPSRARPRCRSVTPCSARIKPACGRTSPAGPTRSR
jgi:DNA-binding transcriptional MerR regulator